MQYLFNLYLPPTPTLAVLGQRAVQAFSLVVASRDDSPVAVYGLTAVASLVAEYTLQAQTQELWCRGLVNSGGM